MTNQIAQLREFLSKPKRIVIVTHPNPDGDAFGSILSMNLFLKKMGHITVPVSPSSFTKNFYWLPAFSEIVSFESHKSTVVSAIAESDVIFCLDFNAVSRLDELGTFLSASKAVKVMIDHHQMPENFADITFSDTKYAATCEFIFDVIAGMGFEDKIDSDIALCLYTGLVTDTGFFGFNNTTLNVHKVAGALIQKGVKPDYVQDKVYNIFREERLRYFGYCLLHKMTLLEDGKVAYIKVTKEEALKFHLRPGDNEGLVNYPFKIEDVKVCALFTEEPGKIKISLRSKDKIDVNTFARKYFEGGGHVNAAGGKSIKPLHEVEALFLSKAKELFE